MTRRILLIGATAVIGALLILFGKSYIDSHTVSADTQYSASAAQREKPPQVTVSDRPNITINVVGGSHSSVPVNEGRDSVTELGSVAHHNGVIVVPKDGVIIAYGDIHQTGGLTYKEFSTPGPLDMNGLPGDVQLVLIQAHGTPGMTAPQVETALTQKVEQFVSGLQAQGYMQDP